MKLNKQQIEGIIAFGIVLVLYNLIAALIPFRHEGVFWISYGFGLIAILSQVPVLLMAFQGDQSVMSRFYGMPIARVGLIYALVQILLSLIGMCLGWVEGIPEWPFLLLFVIILALGCLGVIAASVTRDEVVRQDSTHRANVENMRNLQSATRTLLSQIEGKPGADRVRRLAEELRYSDPVSGEATQALERELLLAVNDLRAAAARGDSNEVSSVCERALRLLAERNRVCKLNK